jgi:hypothetical protein
MPASPPQPVRVYAVNGFIAFDSGGIGSRSHAEKLSPSWLRIPGRENM